MQWSSDQIRSSLASMEADWNGTIMRGIQKITLSDEVKRDPMFGNSSVSIGLPAGQHGAEGELTTIPEEADAIEAALGDSFSQTPGTIGITLFEPNGSGIYVVNVTRVYINKLAADFGEAGGQKGSTKTFSLVILDPIDWNGLALIRDQRGGVSVDLGAFTVGL